MRRTRIAALLALVLLACGIFQPGRLDPEWLPATATLAPFLTAPSAAVTPTPPSELPVAPPATAELTQNEFQVQIHPEGGLYIGDRVSFEIIPLVEFELHGQRASVKIVEPVSREIGVVEFGRYGIGQRVRATLTWAWDTRDLEAGSYTLEFTILPQGAVWRQALALLPADERPQADAVWRESRTDCCVVHTISGTEAERDLEQLSQILDKQSRLVSEQFGLSLEQPVEVTLAPRVLGHGGFASDRITISYLDRLYTASHLEMIFHHELVHIFDSRLGGDLRPTMLVEGLAVYLSGGHFKPEPLLERAAALLPAGPGCTACGLGWYIPLAELADDFYLTQHEAGYLEAAGLVEFLVEQYGWEGFNAFYRDIHPDASGSQASAMDAAMQMHFGLSLAEVEAQFQARLAQSGPSGKGTGLDPKWVTDVRLSVEYFDAVRRYQQRFDPAAYFQTAWLPDVAEMQAAGITADFTRRPERPENIILENLLAAAGEALQAGEYAKAEERLASVQFLLDSIPDLAGARQAN